MIILHNIIKIEQDGKKSKGRKPKWLFALYDYGFIDLTIIYDTVVHGIPEMYEQLKKLL